jgi:hypothetical protein
VRPLRRSAGPWRLLNELTGGLTEPAGASYRRVRSADPSLICWLIS